MFWVLAFILSLVFMGTVFLVSKPVTYAQAAGSNIQDGKFFSEDWSFYDGPPLELSGDWEVIWGEIVPPETFDSRFQGDFFTLPGRWNKINKPGINGPFGSATFRATLALPPYNRNLSYHLIAPHSAYTIYIDGVLVVRNGRVSEASADSRSNYVSRTFPGQSGFSEIVLQVSNHGHAYGGPGHVLTLWDSQRLALFLDTLSLVYGIVMGIMFTIGLFHLILFLADKRDQKNSPIHLWFSILCFIIVYRVQGVIPLFHEYFPDSTYWENLRLTYMSLYAAPAVYLLFFRSVFPEYFPDKLTKLIVTIGFLGVAACMILPEYYYTITRNFSILLNLFVIVYSLIFIVRAAFAKQAGSAVILIANLLFLLTALNDAFIYTDQGSGFDMTPFGILILGLGYSYALLLRLQRRFTNANDTAFALERLNADLERKVQDRTQAFEIAARKAENASDDQARFIAAASHDLRQPLHALTMFNAALTAKLPLGKEKYLVEKQRAAITNLSKLLQDTLDTAQLDNQRKQPNFLYVDAVEFCENLLESFNQRAQSRRIKLSITTQVDSFATDPVILRRILGNLLDNAIKAARSETSLSIDRKAQALVCTVSDDGPGISAHNAQRIFESYVTLNDDLPDEKGGYGLGLYVVKRFTEILSGKIDLVSAPGRGSQFCLTLPEPSLTEPVARQDFQIEDGQKLLIDVKVLAIDDDAEILSSIDALLGSWGCEVQIARDLDAVNWTATAGFSPDICLLDFHMPHSNGLDINKSLPGLFGKDIPVIIITGATEPTILAAIAAQGLSVLEKPVIPAQLFALMQKKLNET